MGAFLLVYINAFLAFDFGQFLMGLKLVTDWVVPEISQKMGFLQIKIKSVFSHFFGILIWWFFKSGIHWRKETLQNFQNPPSNLAKHLKQEMPFSTCQISMAFSKTQNKIFGYPIRHCTRNVWDARLTSQGFFSPLA